MAFGRMERGVQARPMSEINVTPLVDVMLVLVVIFILAAPLLAGSLRLQLPRAQGTAQMAPAPALLIEVSSAGLLQLDGAAIDEGVLAQRLAAVAAERPDTEIALRADAAVPYGRVVELMGFAHAAGLTRIAFVAEPASARSAR